MVLVAYPLVDFGVWDGGWLLGRLCGIRNEDVVLIIELVGGMILD